MSNEVRYVMDQNRTITAEEIAMIEAARELPETFDEDNPPIDPVATPAQYAALMHAVAERNRRIAGKQTGTA